MAGKTKTQILEEKIKQKELDNYEQAMIVDKVKAITDLLSATIPDNDKWISAFNQKGIDKITAKAIELIEQM